MWAAPPPINKSPECCKLRWLTTLKTQPHLHLLEDEADNRILECAILGEADTIVSGDRHLLSLTRDKTISMVKLADFLELLRQPLP